jgi:DNA-binding CsgD family transcriptional regulator
VGKLLAQVIEAHGGLGRWPEVTGISARMTIGGPFWQSKGQPGILGQETVEFTPQELQIAQLAADGLSNREIAQMVYPSHRTVSSHPYRAFPKLGITSRTELRGALEGGIHGLAQIPSHRGGTGL